ncbi:MAG: hypothetical protein JNM34_10625 [Chthonomonadaceae bacterium]|nr:hypothetical protein [Chthonomonadaceae bacterium]
MVKPHSKLGWDQVALSLACSVMLAVEVSTGRSFDLPQSAERYYLSERLTTLFHLTAGTIDVLVLVSTLIWIFTSKSAMVVRVTLVCLSLIGIALAWTEIVYAHHTGVQKYQLQDLPYRPVGNAGLFGAQLFATYLILQLKSGKLGAWSSAMVKICLALSFFLIQLLVWEVVRMR